MEFDSAQLIDGCRFVLGEHGCYQVYGLPGQHGTGPFFAVLTGRHCDTQQWVCEGNYRWSGATLLTARGEGLTRRDAVVNFISNVLAAQKRVEEHP